MKRTLSARTRWQVFAISLTLLPLGCSMEVRSSEVSEIEAPIVGGTNSTGTLAMNAAVWLVAGGGCTGVLIAPDVVWTAAHCNVPIGPAWEDDATIRGEWVTMPFRIPIQVGVNRDWTYYARHASVPGNDDSTLWLLETPVSPSHATPAPAMSAAKFQSIGGTLAGRTLVAEGWGTSLPRRQSALGLYHSENPRGVNTIRAQLSSGATYVGGDSGGPLFLWDSAAGRYETVANHLGTDGVNLGIGHFVASYKTGAGDANKWNISQWLSTQSGAGAGAQRKRFVPSQPHAWSNDACYGTERCATGDFNGDGATDTAAFSSTGGVYVGRSYKFRTWSQLDLSVYPQYQQRGWGFEVGLWANNFTSSGDRVGVGDLNGDFKDDILSYANNGIFVALSTTSAFGPRQTAYTGFACRPARSLCITGDVSGIGGALRDEILEIDMLTGGLRLFANTSPSSTTVSLTQVAGFSTAAVTGLCPNTAECELADMDGDGDADLVIFERQGASRVRVASATSTGFSAPVTWTSAMCQSAQPRTCRTGDVDGDLRADVVEFDHSTRAVMVVRRFGLGSPVFEFGWHSSFCGAGYECRVGDVNGDGQADIVGFVHGSIPSRPGHVEVGTAIF